FVQIQGLRQAVRDGLFQVRFKGQDQTEENIKSFFRRPDSGILHIVPRVAGAGRAGQLIGGVVVVGVGAGLTYTGIGGPIGGYLINAGVGLLIGGVAQMLTKQPKLDTERHGVQQSRNTSFSNLDNTAAQGQPVPLAYGLIYAGSRV
ncbi:phage tail protein, partial [Neisseria dumasiana]